jgi:hypothetical protein
VLIYLCHRRLRHDDMRKTAPIDPPPDDIPI